MRKLIYILAAVVCVACLDNSKTKTVKDSSEIEEYFQFDLKENLDFLGSVKDVTFLSDSLIAIISNNPTRLFFYNMKGEQIKVVKRASDSKSDFLNPAIVKYFNSDLYLWCADLHKFFVYDSNGELIKSIKGPSYAIGDFVIKDGTAYCYINGGQSHWLSIYDLDNETILRDLGSSSNEQLLLDRHLNSGGMTLFENNVFISPSDQLSVFSVAEGLKLQKVKNIADESFKVDSVFQDPYQMVNTDINQLIDYLHQNSYVNGLFNIGDGLVLKAETGFLMQDEQNILNNNNRFENYYLIDSDFNFVKSYRIPHNFYVEGLIFSNSQDLYRLHVAEGEGNFIYKLYKLEFK
jgi:hypothetical protein